MILMHNRWSGICYDYKERYLGVDYVRTLVDRRVDNIVRPIGNRVGLCFSCMINDVSVSCNNAKDEDCKVCRECANWCGDHGFYCRVHG